MAARSFLLRRPTPGARPARRTSSVVAALPALAPRLVRLARHDYSDRLLAIEEIERQREDIGHGHRRARQAGLRADRHRAFLRALREPPVCSLDDGRIERDHVHQVAEAEDLSAERPGGAELHERASGIEEELGGLVAGRAVV